EHLPTRASVDALDRRGHRAEQLRNRLAVMLLPHLRGRVAQESPERARPSLHCARLQPLDTYEREVPARRIAESLALLELVARERIVIVRLRESDRRVLDGPRLHHHAPRTIATARATRHLREQLERALGRARIGQRE